MEKGVPIRSISRGIAVLAAINRHRSLTMMEIARYSAVPYPTACRILQTLLHEGLVEREPSRKRYRPTILVRTLASGFQETDLLVSAAREPLVELGRQAVWPVAICTRVGVTMMVRDSTHSMSPLTFQNYYPGYTLPILSCASGKAYLAFCSDAERESVLSALERQQEDTAVDGISLQLARDGEVFRSVREQGYAAIGRNKFNATPGKTSTISVPVFDGERCVAALAITFFASSMTIAQAARQHVGPLQEAARQIGERIQAGRAEGRPEGGSELFQETAHP